MMAGASTGTNDIDSIVQGHHLLKDWLDSCALEVSQEDDSDHDEYAV